MSQARALQPAPARQSPRLIVGIADMKIVAQGSVELITYALGSCLGLVLYDPVTRVTGLLHAMMPTASIAPDKAAKNPAMFVDTGVPELFKACYRAGAEKKRLIVIAAGCAAVNAAPGMDLFQIGRRNVVVLRKLLWKNGVLLAKHDLEGSDSRTISISTDTGKVTLTTRGKQRVL